MELKETIARSFYRETVHYDAWPDEQDSVKYPFYETADRLIKQFLAAGLEIRFVPKAEEVKVFRQEAPGDRPVENEKKGGTGKRSGKGRST